MIRTLRRSSSILPLTRWLTLAAAAVVIVIFPLTSVNNAIHAVFTLAVSQLIVDAKTGPAACTATLALIMSRECIATSKSAATFEAGMWTLASVEFCVAFQIMQAAETCLAGRAFVRLFLTVG